MAIPAAASARTRSGERSTRYPTSKNVAVAWKVARILRIRSVWPGHGPSSKVSATAFGITTGPVGWNTEDTSLPDSAPRVTTCTPGATARSNCGSLGRSPGTVTFVWTTPSV